MKHCYFLNIWKYLCNIKSSAVLRFSFMCKLAPDVSRTRKYSSEIRSSSVKEDLRCIIFSKISILEPVVFSVCKMFLFLHINLNLPYIQCGQIFFIRKLRRMKEIKEIHIGAAASQWMVWPILLIGWMTEVIGTLKYINWTSVLNIYSHTYKLDILFIVLWQQTISIFNYSTTYTILIISFHQQIMNYLKVKTIIISTRVSDNCLLYVSRVNN